MIRFMDKLDDLLSRHYNRIRSKLISPQKECPGEALFRSYVRGELNQEEREHIDGHLLSCPECLESLKTIRMIEQAEKSSADVPLHLHQRIAEILQKASLKEEPALEKEPAFQPMKKALIRKIVLLWDQLNDKITQLTQEVEDTIVSRRLEFQPVRKAGQDSGKDIHAFPHRMNIQVEEGSISLEIDHADSEEYLTIKACCHFILKKTSPQVRATLCKQGKICSVIHLDEKDGAVFHRIREGTYHLEFLKGEESLVIVELSICTSEK